jgi:hypothetical protein
MDGSLVGFPRYHHVEFSAASGSPDTTGVFAVCWDPRALPETKKKEKIPSKL